jgi:hypothetical protein
VVGAYTDLVVVFVVGTGAGGAGTLLLVDTASVAFKVELVTEVSCRRILVHRRPRYVVREAIQ